MKNYVLGLDIGETSIGWAAVEHADSIPIGFLGIGIHHFPLGAAQEKGKASSAAQQRGDFRRQRRQVSHRKTRKSNIRNFLVQSGLLPDTIEEQNNLFTPVKKGKDDKPNPLRPYELRSKGKTEKLSLFEVGQAIYHLTQRRGYKWSAIGSAEDDDKSRKPKSKNEKELSPSVKIEKTERELSSIGTPAERLLSFREHHSETRFRSNFLFTRAEIVEEFQKIWSHQAGYYPDVFTEDRRTILERLAFQDRDYRVTDERLAALRKEVFVNARRAPGRGHCSLIPSEKRLARSDWLAQKFVIKKTVANIRIHDRKTKSVRELTSEEKQIVFWLIVTNERVNDTAIKNALGFKPATVTLNYDDKTGRGIKGSHLGKTLFEVLGMEQLQTLADDLLIAISNAIPADTDEERMRLHSVVSSLSLPDSLSSALIRTPVPDGYLRFSSRAIQCLLPYIENGDDESKAIEQARKNSEIPKASSWVFERLPKPPKDITNPIVRSALNETRQLVNALIDLHGKPKEIVVELGREIRRTLEERNDVAKQLLENEKKNDKYKAVIRQETGDQDVSGTMLLKYRLWLDQEIHPIKKKKKLEESDRAETLSLWQEQGFTCPYTGETINLTDLCNDGGRNYHIDHILPRSKTLDNSYLNKVLCTRNANQGKLDQTPFEWLGGPDSEKYLRFVERLDHMPNMPEKKKVLLKTPHVAQDNFVERQMNDMRYSSRTARAYLECLYDRSESKTRVRTTQGSITGALRDIWGLNSLLHGRGDDDGGDFRARETKNRDDLRHNAIDAAVVACTSYKHLHNLGDYYRWRDDPGRKNQTFSSNEPWPGFSEALHYELFEKVHSLHLPERVKQSLKETNGIAIVGIHDGILRVRGMVVSHKVPHRTQGMLHKQMPHFLDRESKKLLQAECVERGAAFISTHKGLISKVRKPVQKLKWEEINAGWDEDKHRYDPSKMRICDIGIAMALREFWKKNQLDASDEPEKLDESKWESLKTKVSKETSTPNPIRFVALKETGVVNHPLVLVRKGQIAAYDLGNNHHMVIYEGVNERGKPAWKDVVVPLFTAAERETRGEPVVHRSGPNGEPFVMSLRENELVAFLGDEQQESVVLRVQKISHDDICLRDQFYGGPVDDSRRNKALRKRTNSFRQRLAKLRATILGDLIAIDD